MANAKITELADATALTGAELVETVQGGVNKKTTVAEVANTGTFKKTAAQWTSDNTVLGDGVKGEETDTGKFKVGPGAWNSLSYAGGGGGTWGSITGTLSSQTDLQAALDAKADSVLTYYTKSASYELDTADVTDVGDGKQLNFNMDVATANTFTIPQDSEHDFPIGTVILVDWVGAGQPTITPGTGTTFQGGRYKLSEQYAGCSCKKVAANTWRIQGSLTS